MCIKISPRREGEILYFRSDVLLRKVPQDFFFVLLRNEDHKINHANLSRAVKLFLSLAPSIEDHVSNYHQRLKLG